MSLFDATLTGIVPSAWWLADLALRSFLLLSLVRVALALLHRRSAAQRHLAGLCGLLALVALPVAMLVLPAGIGLLPSLVPTGASSGTSDPGALAAAPLWLTALLVAWGAVGIVLTAPALRASHRLERYFRRGESLPGATSILASARRRVDLRLRPEIRCSNEVDIPITFGLVEPKILLPAEASTWSHDRLEWVLLHELAHIARRDPAAQAVGIAACCIFWWQPMVWRLAQRLELEREHAADDRVLAYRGDAIAYARQLFDIAEGLRGRPITAFGLSMARPSQLGPRLHAMLDTGIDRSRSGLRHATIVMLGLASTLTLLAGVPGPGSAPDALHAATTPAVGGLDLTPSAATPMRMRAAHSGHRSNRRSGHLPSGHRSGHVSSGHRSGHAASGHRSGR